MVPVQKYEKTVALPMNKVCVLCSAELVSDRRLDENFRFFLNYKKVKGFGVPDHIPQVMYVQVDLDG
jgi:hypothetical protein